MPGVQAVQEALQAESKAEVRKLPAHMRFSCNVVNMRRLARFSMVAGHQLHQATGHVAARGLRHLQEDGGPQMDFFCLPANRGLGYFGDAFGCMS